MPFSSSAAPPASAPSPAIPHLLQAMPSSTPQPQNAPQSKFYKPIPLSQQPQAQHSPTQPLPQPSATPSMIPSGLASLSESSSPAPVRPTPRLPSLPVLAQQQQTLTQPPPQSTPALQQPQPTQRNGHNLRGKLLVVDNPLLPSGKPAIVVLDAVCELPLQSSSSKQKYKYTISSVQTPSVLGWKQRKLVLPCKGRVAAVASSVSTSMGVALVNAYKLDGSRSPSPVVADASHTHDHQDEKAEDKDNQKAVGEESPPEEVQREEEDDVIFPGKSGRSCLIVFPLQWDSSREFVTDGNTVSMNVPQEKCRVIELSFDALGMTRQNDSDVFIVTGTNGSLHLFIENEQRQIGEVALNSQLPELADVQSDSRSSPVLCVNVERIAGKLVSACGCANGYLFLAVKDLSTGTVSKDHLFLDGPVTSISFCPSDKGKSHMLDSNIDSSFVKPTMVQSIIQSVHSLAVVDDPLVVSPKPVVVDPCVSPNSSSLMVAPCKSPSPLAGNGLSSSSSSSSLAASEPHPINIVVGAANGHAAVFMDVENKLLSAQVVLDLPPPEEPGRDIVSAVVGYRHIDFKGEATCNVLVAYGKRLLLFCGSGPTTLKLIWSKENESPILKAALSDITGDFVPEMIVLTLTSCHVLQQTLLLNDIKQSVKEELYQLARIQKLEAAIRELQSTDSSQHNVSNAS